jgi:hypothetical protein
MHLKKILVSLVLGLALFSGISGAWLAPAAHAARGIHPCIVVTCAVAPTLTVSGGDGELYIRGAGWAANRWLELYIYAPVGSGLPELTTQDVFTSSNGTFLSVYIPPGACFYGQMEVQAVDLVSTTVVTSYGEPGCIG